ISRGDKEEAEMLLKGWAYTKNQLDVRETTQELKDVLTAEVSREINLQKRTTLILLILVIISLVVLIISWYISINQWLKNIKERKEKEEEIIFLSYHDTLTNLCNRRSFMEAAQEEIKQAKSSNQYLAIIMMNIDNFKTINDNFGHNIGDLVLKRVAARLRDNLSQDDIISRLGGDEFTIIITDISSKKDSKEKINNLVNSFNDPLLIEESKLFISVSTGISFYPDDAEQLEKLVKKADDAMYRAKKEQKGQVFYSNY
ncbi:MAG: GGDEF domain-containing protein, partial [Halanaerobacter sp.]